jgi:hypothetical protein
MRRVGILVAALVLGGCGAWGQAGFDGGTSSDNRADTTITAANVAQLHEGWKLPGSAVVLGGGFAFTTFGDPSPSARHALVAYPEQGCTGSGIPTCAEAWSRDGLYSQPVTDGASVFVVDRAANVVRAFGVDGSPRWTYTPAPVTGATTTLATTLRVADGRLWAQAVDVTAANVRTDRLVALPTNGCGASTCTAVTTIGGDPIDNFLAAEGVVFSDRALRVHMYDAATGNELWRTGDPTRENPTLGSGVPIALRDGLAITHAFCEKGGTCSETLTYDVHPTDPCTQDPCFKYSMYGWMHSNAQGVIATRPQPVGVDTGGALSWWDCTTHTRCAETALYPTAGIPTDSGYAKAGDLIFTVGQASRTGPVRIRAVVNAPDACPQGVTVRVCSDVWTTDTSHHVHGLVVAGGRLYASEDDGAVHVYTL